MLSNLNDLGPMKEMGKDILVVDDESGVRFLIGEILQGDARKIHLASNGKQALALLEQEKIDIVLLDINMPGMNGVDVYKALKMRNYQGKVIMMTAHEEGELVEKAKSLGVKKFLIKPFDINELKQAVIDKEAYKSSLPRRKLV